MKRERKDYTGEEKVAILRKHLLATHDKRDVAAELIEHVHELNTGDSRANNDEMRRQLLWRICVACREHAISIG